MEKQGSKISAKKIKVMIFMMLVFSFFSNTAFAQCTADFSADQTSGCAPLTVKFTDNSQEATDWNWYFEGGSPSEAQGQGPHEVTFNNPGDFDVTLKISCQQGSDTKTMEEYIQVTDCTCEADFSADQTSGCATLTVTFTDQSQNATSWNWSFPGGSPSSATGQGPHQVKYTNPGEYDAKLLINCQQGSDSETKFITVNDCTCEADFTADQTSACAPLTVKFSDNSQIASSWSWSFPGGSPSSAQGQGPHYITYNNPGNYSATLDINCPYGSDSKTRNNYIQANDCTCEANFKGEPTSGMVPLTVTFTDLSQNATSWDWSFPGGEPSTAQGMGPHTVTYNDTGSYNVSLGISCPHNSDIITRNNYIWVESVILLYDYGDAPDPLYLTLFVNNGARHNIESGFYLGSGVDNDSNGQPDPNALGDDNDGNDDEDGITFNSPLVQGDTTEIEVIVSAVGILDAWIDFENNGSWAETENQIFNSQTVIAGSNVLEFVVPGMAVQGVTFARFRLSHSGGLSFNGFASAGEVEDYEVLIEPGRDWGDAYDFATDPRLHTLAVNNGANHLVVPGFCLGTLIDAEPDGIPGIMVDGDDNSGIDDEDGVRLLADMIANYPAEIEVIATIPPGLEGYLDAWIDFDGEGDWEPGDQIYSRQPLLHGVNLLTFIVPPAANVGGGVHSRFRLSQEGGLSFAGAASNGEVEDHRIRIEDPRDWGDAPAPYPTVGRNGASHLTNSDYFLGSLIDNEPNGQPHPNALGDDHNLSDDEDGVTFESSLIQGNEAKIKVIASRDGGFLNAWIDYSDDGDWEDAEEHIFENIELIAGENILTFDVPVIAVASDSTFARFRFCALRDTPFFGRDTSGEVEDYALFIEPTMTFRRDFGDAPIPYKTMLSDSGAYHFINPDIFLGQGVDDEPDGQPDQDALGDDNDGNDDEDGVIFPDSLVVGDTAVVEITASVSGYLKAWIDFDQDGDWDNPGETVINNSQVAKGSNSVPIVIPLETKEGSTYARFRFSDDMIASYEGHATSGEVEDYVFNFVKLFKHEFGDAPEGALAYPHSGQIGYFPTCEHYDEYSEWFGYSGYIRHGVLEFPPTMYFGESADLEHDGNNGLCPTFYPDQYDQDETCSDGDAGIIGPVVYSIVGEEGSERLIPVGNYPGIQLWTCDAMRWGEEIDISYTVNAEAGAYINVLFDWNQDGRWSPGFSTCGYPAATYEHVLKNFHVPRGSGRLSDHTLPPFYSGRDYGYIWVRFSITEREVELVELDEEDHWKGSGVFADGETEDYLLYFNGLYARDFGDAPDSSLAYPHSGQMGYFPTCARGIPGDPRYIDHGPDGWHKIYFGLGDWQPTKEFNGNHGFCRCTFFHHFNMDIDNGLMRVKPFTISGPEGTETVIEELYTDFYIDWAGRHHSIGRACQLARWGDNIDIAWTNVTFEEAYINVLIDWNQDGEWSGSVSCPGSMKALEEHVLKNFSVQGGSNPSITALGGDPNDFRIGPNSGYVWARFTITERPVELPWDGTGHFEDGETEDYLLLVDGHHDLFDWGDAWGYNSLSIDFGAVHLIESGFFLGDTVDTEPDGQPDKNAEGDDKAGVDDEDGVEFITRLEPGKEATVVVTASTSGLLNAWIDFDADTSWDDVDENIFSDDEMEAGKNTRTFMVPDDAVVGITFSRFRFSDVGGLSYDGPATFGEQSETPPIGEVEDHKVTISKATSVEQGVRTGSIPLNYELSQNIPNPFNPTTEIHFALPKTEHVNLSIYNLVGQKLRTIVNERKETGHYVVQWDAKDVNGSQLPTGIYIYQMKAGDFVGTKKLILVK